MALSVADFWKLLVQSRLLSREQCQKLSVGFSALPGAATAPGKTLAEWLVRQNVLSKYQAVILLAGRAGPFFYGDYKIYDRVESGRLAGSFRAVHVGTNHRVMLRFLAGAVTRSPHVWPEILSRLPITAHPNLERCYQAVDLGSYKFLVLEDLRGQSLAELLEKSKRIPSDEACRLARLAAIGLSRLHECGQAHGDVRPHNMWLEQSGNLKLLLDLETGARSFNPLTAAAEPDGLVRADYAAPEFLQAGRPADPLTDIYALGCSLYHLIAGQPPFPDTEIARKLHRHATEAIRPLDAVGAPPTLTQLVAYSMAKNPAVRFQQASILAEQLVQFVGAAQQNLKATTPLSTQSPYELWVQQQPAPTTARPQAAMPQTVAGPMVANTALPAPQQPFQTPQTMAGPQPTFPSAGAVPAAGMPVFPGGQPAGFPAAPVAGASQVGAPVVGAPVVGAPVVGAPGMAGPVAAAAFPVAGPAAGMPAASKASSVSAAIKKRARAKKRNNIIFLALSLLSVAGALYAVYHIASQSEVASGERDKKGKEGFGAPSSGTPAPAGPAGTAGPTAQPAEGKLRGSGSPNGAGPSDQATAALTPDDGQALWASPTAGQPIQLKYVPPGAQLFLIARPADLLANPEGERVLKALGPQFESARAQWESAHGMKLADIEQLIVAFYGNQGSAPKTAWIVRLAAEGNPDSLLAAWGSPTPVEGSSGFYHKGETGYYIPEDDPRSVVIGPFDPEMKDAAAAGWKPPLLRREIGQLLQTSDDRRHLTLLFAPNFLFGDGQELFAGDLARARKSLEWFLGDGLKSSLVSVHLADNFYFEMRMESDIQIDRFTLASQVRERLAEVPSRIESYIAELNPHPYWRLVAFRYPAMVRFLHEHTRVGVEGSHAMVNAVLPTQAAHNLVFGGEMVLASSPGVAMASSGPAKPSAPQNLDELLKAKISIGFAQDSLEFAMQNIVTEAKAAYPDLPFDFQIKILGTDLEKDGITRNQQIRDFNLQDKTVADVLTAMVMKANPVTTVKSPDEVDQKLLWVVAPDPEKPDQRVVLITTRTAAGLKKYTLPAVFQTK